VLAGKRIKLRNVPEDIPKPILGNGSAQSSVNALKLKTKLSLEQNNILTNNGKLTDNAIINSTKIDLADSVIGNPPIVKALTRDGSDIKDWQKFKTEKTLGPNDKPIEVHFYKNNKTGKIDYETVDYKVKGTVPAFLKATPPKEPTVPPSG
jgi:filamentous hemagglutinin